jgi:hypothetical protein
MKVRFDDVCGKAGKLLEVKVHMMGDLIDRKKRFADVMVKSMRSLLTLCAEIN